MNNKKLMWVFGILMIIVSIGIIIAFPPSWVGSNIDYNVSEDTTYYHDLRNNITGYNSDVYFYIDSDTDIQLTNSSGTYNFTKTQLSYFISIDNQINGNFSINSTKDNETGFFEIPIQGKNITDNESSVTIFEFMVNATNDYPIFTQVNDEYNLTQGYLFSEYLNASDQESHYPLFFNLSFLNNCSLANWSTRTNCSVFNLISTSNTTNIMNFTPTHNDAGIYYANLSVRDYGENYNCSSGYCDENYSENKTTFYSNIIVFNVFATLNLNVSDCQNKIFQENVSNNCTIVIETPGIDDSVNISSYAGLRNYYNNASNVSNLSWFYSNHLINASNFTIQIPINITPGKTEVGNWTINFSISDLDTADNETAQIYIYVNRTYNDDIELGTIPDKQTSIDLLTTIDIEAYDDDLMIPDKNETYGGYNETSNFTVIILNQSNLSQELSLQGFDVEIIAMPENGTNKTTAKIEFTPNSSEAGDYTINLSVSDKEGTFDFQLFNLSIISNTFPLWNVSKNYYFNLTVNSSLATTSTFNLNLSDGYFWDNDVGDNLTFSNTTAYMVYFNVAPNGIINFKPYKEDVGIYTVNVRATDILGLANSTVFTFNITNINSPIYAWKTPSGNISIYEENETIITLWIEDEEIRIRNKSLYNETPSINLTIAGPNSSLFNFTKDPSFPSPSFPNRTMYVANFTPYKPSVGDYNITINVTDSENSYYVLEFNISIAPINHNPVLDNVPNQNFLPNDTFAYRINATDIEDGASNQSGNNNFTFSYEFLNDGKTPGFLNSTTLNSSSGEINVTFNSSHIGGYHLNITVNDSTNMTGSMDFWVFVYDNPEINLPLGTYSFSLVENQTSNLTFNANHTAGNNLIYTIYIDGILRHNSSGYGNGTDFIWQFTPNFTDETNSSNITLITSNQYYPFLNDSQTWNLSINHTNYPIQFTNNIGGGDSRESGNNNVRLQLSDYFEDIDAVDDLHNQTINFTYSLINSSGGAISVSISNWINGKIPTINFSASTSGSAAYTVTAYEYNESNLSQVLRTVTSNEFSIDITAINQNVYVPGGTGGSATTPISFKIIAPGQVNTFYYERVEIPIRLENTGDRGFSRITLTSRAFKDGNVSDRVETSIIQSFFPSLGVGGFYETTLIVFMDTDEPGDYHIVVDANSESPSYHDWAEIDIILEELNMTEIRELLIFTEQFLVKNPECAEITEILNEAKEYYKKGDLENTKIKAQEAIDACKEFISQGPAAVPKIRFKKSYLVNEYLLVSVIVALMIGVIYYSIKRGKYIRKAKKIKEESEKYGVH